MESLGRFPRLVDVLPWRRLKVSPRDFLKAFGLAEDLAKGLPLEYPKGGLQYAFEGVR